MEKDLRFKLFELYAPFIYSLQNQLGQEFIESLNDYGILIAYNNFFLSASGKLNQHQVNFQEKMDRDIRRLKDDFPFKATYYLAWVIFVISLIPLKTDSSTSSEDGGDLRSFFYSSLCDVDLSNTDFCSFADLVIL